jgi:hypothetical protein
MIEAADAKVRAATRWTVCLCAATLPRPLGVLAVHHWFVLLDPDTGTRERWEVWQDRDAGGTSWGHVHRDLMGADRPVGGGPCVAQRQWEGEEAWRIAGVLREPERYPCADCYRAWPGPNSNTYAAWVLREAGIEPELDPRAIGKDYPAPGAALAAGKRSIHAGPLAGFAAGGGAFELHLIGLTFGLDWRRRSLLTPFGRWPSPGS